MNKIGQKTKILYVITKANKGGAQRHVYDLATNLPKANFETIVATGGEGWLTEELSKANIHTLRIKKLERDINFFKEIVAFFNLIKIFRKERPDIIHLHSSKIGGLGSLAGRLTGIKKIIFTGHGWAFNEDRFFISKWFIALLHWATVLLAHKTIAVSNPVYKQIIKMPFIKNKVVVIHNGISNMNFEEKNTARKKLLGETPNGTWIGTISELHKNKGLEYAIQAVAILKKTERNRPKIIFVIVGEGEERYNLEKLIKQKGLEKNVFLVGHKNEASSLLKAFDIFTLTSITEAFPYALLEAGLAGLPVVASYTGGIVDIIDDKNSGLLVGSKNPNEIANAIKNLLENQNKASDLGENLKSKVQKSFNTNKMLEQISRIYK